MQPDQALPLGSFLQDLFGLAIVSLLRVHVTNSAVIAFGVIDKDKSFNDFLELIETHIVLVLEPVVFENPKPGLNPAIVRGSPVAGKELLYTLLFTPIMLRVYILIFTR